MSSAETYAGRNDEQVERASIGTSSAGGRACRRRGHHPGRAWILCLGRDRLSPVVHRLVAAGPGLGGGDRAALSVRASGVDHDWLWAESVAPGAAHRSQGGGLTTFSLKRRQEAIDSPCGWSSEPAQPLG